MNYVKDKNDLFKKRINHRKSELNYIKNSKRKERCEICCYFNSLSPSMNRCILVSLTIENRSASIKRDAVCDYFGSYINEENINKFKNIEYEQISCVEVAKFKLNGIFI
jgi:hypothetical protein